MRCAYPHPHPEHPCGEGLEKPGEPCRFCARPVPMNGDPCPECWTSLEDLSPAEVKALFARHEPDLQIVHGAEGE